jgi:hypothetical protein
MSNAVLFIDEFISRDQVWSSTLNDNYIGGISFQIRPRLRD